MARDIDDELLVHYVVGECTERERARIEAWIKEDRRNRQRVERLREIWEAAGERTLHESDSMWAGLSRRAGISERQRKARNSRAISRCRRTLLEQWRQPVRAVVGLAVVVTLVFTFDYFVTGGTGWFGEPAMREVKTETGERARVSLGEGTRVVLNAQSTLKLPEKFASDERSVYLQGEAYFEVAPDARRSFLVHAGRTVTRVVGTKFSVGAYAADETVRVVVVEGKVAVREEAAREERALELSGRQMGTFSENERWTLRQEVDPNHYLAWMEDRLVFRDAPFGEVKRKLERWYGIRIQLETGLEDLDRLNASFAGEPLPEVLGIVAESLGLRIERDGGVVTFSAARSE
jgi:ferric-dicitrate binding protein FerR (iron transport regulator)